MKTIKIQEGSIIEEKLLKSIANRGRHLGRNLYLLDDQDLYELSSQQIRRLEEIREH